VTHHHPTQALHVGHAQTPGYLPAPGSHPAPARPSGVRFWALGFLWFIPFIGAVLAPILLGVAAAQNRRHPEPLVRENARLAANWVLTATLAAALGTALVVLIGIMHLVLTGTTEIGSELSPLMLVPNLLLWATWITHLTVCCIGVASAGSRIVNPRIAIPFFPPAR
jgi:uncharacterized Tic20 family protein